MKASEGDVGGVLKKSNRFSVPKFQRPYVWVELDQRRLWEAVEYQAGLMRGRGSTSKPDQFIGSVVLAKRGGKSSASDPDHYSIIDGQQRLMTVSVFLAALRDSTFDQDSPKGEADFDRFTRTHLRVSMGSGQSRLLIEPQGSDRLPYQEIVDYEDATEPKHLLIQCYDNAMGWIATAQKRDKTFSRDRYVKALLNRLAIVSIELDHRDNAHRVFYSLNSLGRPLSRSEKVKTLFSMSAGSRADELYDDYWRPMVIDVGGDGRVEDYLLSRLIIKKNAINKPQIEQAYTSVLERFDGNANKVMSEAKRLHGGVQSFRYATGAEEHPKASLSVRLGRLNDWGVTPAWPLVTLILDELDGGRLSQPNASKALLMIESLVVRRFVCGIPPNDLRSRLTDITVKLDRGSALPADLRTRLMEPTNRWLSDTEIRQLILTTSVYEPRRTKQLLLLFQWLSEDVQGVQTPTLRTPNYQIEHVLPQSHGEWAGDLRGWGVKNIDDFVARRLHVIGNLTPLQHQANAGAGRERLNIKQVKYYKKSPLTITRRLATKATWTEADIDARGKALANGIARLWPR